MHYFANYVSVDKVNSLVDGEPPSSCRFDLVIETAEDIELVLLGCHVNCITESGAQDLNVVDGLEPLDWSSNAPFPSSQS